MKSFIFVVFFQVLLTPSVWAVTPPAIQKLPICKQLSSAIEKGKATEKLNQFLDLQWKYLMGEFPEWATFVGEAGHNDVWTDYSMPAVARRKADAKCQLEILKKIFAQSLLGEDKVNFELAKRNLEVSIEGQEFDGDFLILSQMGGVHQELADILDNMPAAKMKDYEDILTRLERFPVLVDQHEALLREGVKRKVTALKMLLAKVPAQIDHLLTPKVEESPYFKVFVDMKGDLTGSQKTEIRERAQKILTTKIYPRLASFKEFLVKDYIPNAREFISWSEMPNGKAWYAHLVKEQTTTNRTPEELHQLGLSEVARISGEMQKVRDKLKFKGDQKSFNHFLLTDKQFYYQNKEDLLTGYRDIAKRIDPELPKLFKELPRLTYGVREMPEFKAKEAPGAYYEGGSLEAGRAGYFTANTYDLKARPKWSMEALTMHEAVPGHHLQIARAAELKGLPKFRTEGGFTAYVEGWALYAEGLGEEMGFYKDPYSKYGQLTYEMWRAVRLVVDTGMHALAWSRSQAIDYMKNVMPKSDLEIEVEIDRYISWPGQALAYKVGELKFRELRKKAEASLGADFNIRAFHDELLRHGALPMDVLEKIMNDWTREELKKK